MRPHVSQDARIIAYFAQQRNGVESVLLDAQRLCRARELVGIVHGVVAKRTAAAVAVAVAVAVDAHHALSHWSGAVVILVYASFISSTRSRSPPFTRYGSGSIYGIPFHDL